MLGILPFLKNSLKIWKYNKRMNYVPALQASTGHSTLRVLCRLCGRYENVMKTIVFLMFCTCASNSYSTVQVSAYDEFKNEPFMISFVWGATSGLLVAAAVNEEKGGNKLFCTPEDLAISNEEAIKIFESELYDKSRNKKYADETPISMVFLFALEKKYPCKQPKIL